MVSFQETVHKDLTEFVGVLEFSVVGTFVSGTVGNGGLESTTSGGMGNNISGSLSCRSQLSLNKSGNSHQTRHELMRLGFGVYICEGAV